jgi:AcrR family transcriptional regulator
VLTCQGVAEKSSNPAPRKRRSDGERSREAILRKAATLATVEGIDGLSIGRLADAVGMSKSGLFAHFGSKEELQLATIQKAGEVFTEQVVVPGSEAPSGLEKLALMGELYFQHVESGLYPGGCFFTTVSTELGTRSGPTRDMAVGYVNDWVLELERVAAAGQKDGSINAAEDPPQLAFEIEALLLNSNARFIAAPETEPMTRARLALKTRLSTAAA